MHTNFDDSPDPPPPHLFPGDNKAIQNYNNHQEAGANSICNNQVARNGAKGSEDTDGHVVDQEVQQPAHEEPVDHSNAHFSADAIKQGQVLQRHCDTFCGSRIFSCRHMRNLEATATALRTNCYVSRTAGNSNRRPISSCLILTLHKAIHSNTAHDDVQYCLSFHDFIIPTCTCQPQYCCGNSSSQASTHAASDCQKIVLPTGVVYSPTYTPSCCCQLVVCRHSSELRKLSIDSGHAQLLGLEARNI